MEAQLKQIRRIPFQVLAYEPYLALCERTTSEGTGRFRHKKRCPRPPEAVEKRGENAPRGDKMQRRYRV